MACPNPPVGGGKGPGYSRPNGFIRAGATIFFAGGPTKKDFRCYPRPNRFIRAGLTQGLFKQQQYYFIINSRIY